MSRPEIHPSVGFCIQTDSLGTPAGRWYLNMVRHSLCEMPVSHSGKIVSREFILGHGIGSMKIPFDMGSFRKLKERADGARHTAYCVDIVFNPFIIQMFTDDDFNNIMKEYRSFIINLVLQRVESSIGVKLSMQKAKLVKKFLYKDGTGANCDIPRALTDLPQEIDEVEEVQPQRPPPAEEAPAEPLIQDMSKKKPALKKGFLNKPSAALYPEGSKEGVLPENAGDPLGYLPKSLRKTCKVVDTNSPQYQEQQKQQQAAQSHNDMNKEFQDMLQKDLGHYNKANSMWDNNDLPDGTEVLATQKYDNDYSRFDKMDDVEEDKPGVENRDYYYDEKGIPRKFATAQSSTKATSANAEPTMKKGFLDNAKAPLYPKGSEQGSAPPDEADPHRVREMLGGIGDEDELFQQFGKLMSGSLGEGGLPVPQSRTPQAQKPNIVAKVPERKAPEFTLERDDNEGLLQLAVVVPGLESMKGVDLDVTEGVASFAFPSSVGLKPLKVELPAAVIPSGVRAKFSKKTHQINVKLPLLLQVAKAG